MGLPDYFIYVNNNGGDDNYSGDIDHPLATADQAFRRLPPCWYRQAEIIFAPTRIDYPITTSAVSFGTPVGPDASPLVLRGTYFNDFEVSAGYASSVNEIVIREPGSFSPDDLIGRVVTRYNEYSPPGPAISIRSNTNSTIRL